MNPTVGESGAEELIVGRPGELVQGSPAGGKRTMVRRI
jgi:hypothetical protein